MRLLVNTASRGIVAMALVSPLLFGGCDASKAELQTTKSKLTAITTERDGLKTQLSATQASLESAKKERDATIAKLAATEAEAAAIAKRCPETPPEPVVPAKPTPTAPAPAQGKKLGGGGKNSALSNALAEKGPAVQQCAIEHAMDKGAKKVVISVRVTINSRGMVEDSRVTATVTDGDSSRVKSCVESVVRSAKFPAIATPLATDERSWTIAAE